MNHINYQGSENEYSQTSYQHNERLLTTLPTAQLPPVMDVAVSTPAAAWSEAVAVFLASGVDSAGTRRAYGRHLRNAGQLFGNIPVAEITGGDLACLSCPRPWFRPRAIDPVPGFVGPAQLPWLGREPRWPSSPSGGNPCCPAYPAGLGADALFGQHGKGDRDDVRGCRDTGTGAAWCLARGGVAGRGGGRALRRRHHRGPGWLRLTVRRAGEGTQGPRGSDWP